MRWPKQKCLVLGSANMYNNSGKEREREREKVVGTQLDVKRKSLFSIKNSFLFLYLLAATD